MDGLPRGAGGLLVCVLCVGVGVGECNMAGGWGGRGREGNAVQHIGIGE